MVATTSNADWASTAQQPNNAGNNGGNAGNTTGQQSAPTQSYRSIAAEMLGTRSADIGTTTAGIVLGHYQRSQERVTANADAPVVFAVGQNNPFFDNPYPFIVAGKVSDAGVFEYSIVFLSNGIQMPMQQPTVVTVAFEGGVQQNLQVPLTPVSAVIPCLEGINQNMSGFIRTTSLLPVVPHAYRRVLYTVETEFEDNASFAIRVVEQLKSQLKYTQARIHPFGELVSTLLKAFDIAPKGDSNRDHSRRLTLRMTAERLSAHEVNLTGAMFKLSVMFATEQVQGTQAVYGNQKNSQSIPIAELYVQIDGLLVARARNGNPTPVSRVEPMIKIVKIETCGNAPIVATQIAIFAVSKHAIAIMQNALSQQGAAMGSSKKLDPAALNLTLVPKMSGTDLTTYADATCTSAHGAGCDPTARVRIIANTMDVTNVHIALHIPAGHGDPALRYIGTHIAESNGEYWRDCFTKLVGGSPLTGAVVDMYVPTFSNTIHGPHGKMPDTVYNNIFTIAAAAPEAPLANSWGMYARSNQSSSAHQLQATYQHLVLPALVGGAEIEPLGGAVIFKLAAGIINDAQKAFDDILQAHGIAVTMNGVLVNGDATNIIGANPMASLGSGATINGMGNTGYGAII